MPKIRVSIEVPAHLMDDIIDDAARHVAGPLGYAQYDSREPESLNWVRETFAKALANLLKQQTTFDGVQQHIAEAERDFDHHSPDTRLDDV